MAEEELNDSLNVRVNSTELSTFKDKSIRSTGKPYQILVREIMEAFNDGRLRIIPTKDQKSGELYNVN